MNHWLYPTSSNSSYYLEVAGQQVPVDPANFAAGVSHSSGSADSWVISTGFNIMTKDDLIWAYFGAPHSALMGLGRVIRDPYSRDDGYTAVDILWDELATAALLATPIPSTAFTDTPRSLRRFGDASAALLDAWLSDVGVPPSVLGGDEDEDLSDEDARRRRLAAVVQRQGQVDFRRRLLAAYNHQCAITSCDVPEALEAAHIRPYNGVQTNKVTNGLLLRADLHTLFDLHLVGVDAGGQVVTSSQLVGSAYASLAGIPLRAATPSAAVASKRALAKHLRQLR